MGSRFLGWCLGGCVSSSDAEVQLLQGALQEEQRGRGSSAWLCCRNTGTVPIPGEHPVVSPPAALCLTTPSLHEQRVASTVQGDFVESVRKWPCKCLYRIPVFVGF